MLVNKSFEYDTMEAKIVKTIISPTTWYTEKLELGSGVFIIYLLIILIKSVKRLNINPIFW
jgi:hypothetical protein